jgi:hypothetical protein
MRRPLTALLLASVLSGVAFADDDPRDPRDSREKPKLEAREDASKPHYDYACDRSGQLYQIDCSTLSFRRLGQVQVRAANGKAREIPELCDLAATPDGYLYGVSPKGLYLINLSDPTRSKKIGEHGLPAPWGMAAVGGELLVNTSTGGVHLIDRKTAKPRQVGPMGKSWGASGDIAWFGEKVFSSVKNGSGVEHLVEIDDKTGMAIEVGAFKDQQGRPISHVFGLIDRKGQLFGLTSRGDIVSIDPKTARCKVLKKTGISWWGATSFTRM